MRNYNPKRPPIPACGLIEDDPEEFEEEDLLSDSPTFSLEVFPDGIRNIVEAFEEYENFNVDFTAASFLTVFAAAMGNRWSVRFMTGWIDRPIIYTYVFGIDYGLLHQNRYRVILILVILTIQHKTS